MAISTAENNKSAIRSDWVATEAIRCLNCFDPPCQKACPAAIPIPEFIYSIKSGNLRYAAKLVREANPVVAICGAVCPEEIFCQSACTRSKIDRAINIRELHGFASTHETVLKNKSESGASKIAIIGAGPAGLSAATKLADAGYKITIFDKHSHIGGVPNSSIPKFRLSDEIIGLDIGYAENLGIEIKLNNAIDDPSILLNDFDAVLIAAGLNLNRRPDIKGEMLPEVTDAITFLEQARSGKIKELNDKRVAVIGGGNVSLDVAATAASLGASETRLYYRRGPAEMKVWRSELAEAQKRGIIIEYLTAPVEIMGEGGEIEAVQCARVELDSRCDSSGRRIPRLIRGSEFMTHADLVITAIGLSSDFAEDIKANSDLSTNVPGIFAAGDWARGEGTIVEAVRDGKFAAQSIINYLKEKSK